MFTADRVARGVRERRFGGMSERLQEIVDEYAAALGVPAGRVTWSWMPRYPSRSRGLDLVMFDDPPERFDLDRVNACAFMVRAILGYPTLGDVVQAAVAEGLFGWLP